MRSLRASQRNFFYKKQKHKKLLHICHAFYVSIFASCAFWFCLGLCGFAFLFYCKWQVTFYLTIIKNIFIYCPIIMCHLIWKIQNMGPSLVNRRMAPSLPVHAGVYYISTPKGGARIQSVVFVFRFRFRFSSQRISNSLFYLICMYTEQVLIIVGVSGSHVMKILCYITSQYWTLQIIYSEVYSGMLKFFIQKNYIIFSSQKDKWSC